MILSDEKLQMDLDIVDDKPKYTDKEVTEIMKDRDTRIKQLEEMNNLLISRIHRLEASRLE